VVNAFVMGKGRKQQIAVRSWYLVDEGIAVECLCEKGYRCPAHGRLLEVADDASIEAQIEDQIEQLRREYGLAARRVFRHAFIHGVPRQTTRVILRGEWKR
jgi:hypothetical protein